MFSKRLARLRGDVVAADDVALSVRRHAARDEEQVADPDGVRVVADRRAELGDADLLAVCHWLSSLIGPEPNPILGAHTRKEPP